MAENDNAELWVKYTDDDGKEHFEPFEAEEDCSFDLDEATAEYDREEVKSLCGKTLREKYFLEGMVHAYERVLLIDFDDDGEDEF